MSYKVETEVFQGPFDLLLHLILKNDVDLYEIKLGEIVDAYLAELAKMETYDLEISTEFLLIASTLIELKCRRLLPSDKEHDLDEELGLWEERDLLLSRLLECKTFKDASKVLVALFEQAQLVVPRTSGLEEQFLDLSPDPLAGMTTAKLRRAFLRVASEKPRPQVSLHHVAKIKVSVADAISEFAAVLPDAGKQTFRSFIDEDMERLEVVVRFLAVLELFKQGLVVLEQQECFGDLSISWAGDNASGEMALAGVDSYEG